MSETKAIAFKILKGPLEGQIFKISKGLTLGRQKADLVIEDKKISSHHATVIETIVENESKFHLEDAGSRNGLFVKEERVNTIELTPETQFRIGHTQVLIVEVNEDHPDLKDPRETWQDILVQNVHSIVRKNRFTPSPVGPFTPALKLTFIQGRQVETEWFVGYGPRSFGLFSLEFPIHEPSMPDHCFEVYPNDGAWFKTEHPQLIRLNNCEVPAERLNDGDRIHFGESIIQVSFVSEPTNE